VLSLGLLGRVAIRLTRGFSVEEVGTVAYYCESGALVDAVI
jgi:hypothetical protein